MSNKTSYHEKEINTQALYKEWNEIIQQGIDVKKKQQEQSRYYTKMDQGFIACRNKTAAIMPEIETVIKKAENATPVIPLKHNYKKGEKHAPTNEQEAKELKMTPEGTSYKDLLKVISTFFEVAVMAKKEMDRMSGTFNNLNNEANKSEASGTMKMMIDILSKMDSGRHQPGNLAYLKAGKNQFVESFKGVSHLQNLTQGVLDDYTNDSKRDLSLLTLINGSINQGFAYIQKFFGAIILTYADETGKDEELDNGLNLLIEIHNMLISYRYHISELNLYSLEAIQILTAKQNFTSKMITIQALFYENLFDLK